MAGTARQLAFLGGMIFAMICGCTRPDVTPYMQELAKRDEQWLSQPPPDPARKILSSLDEVQSLQQWFVGADVLYVVRIERDDDIRIHYVRVQIKSDVLNEIARVRLNPPPGPAGQEKVLDIFDPGQGTYELPVVGWSGEGTTEIDTLTKDEAAEESSAAPRKFHSDAVLAWMALYDEAGNLESARYALLPAAFLRKGLLALCEIAAGMDPQSTAPEEMTPAKAAIVEESNFAMRCLGKVVAESQVARPIVRGIVPGFDLLLMRLFRPQFTHTLRGATVVTDSEGLPAVEKYGPACRLELDINVNSRPTIRCFITVAPPHSPIDVCAGVIALQCAHLDDPSRRVSVHLLAARRPAADADTPELVTRPAGARLDGH